MTTIQNNSLDYGVEPVFSTIDVEIKDDNIVINPFSSPIKLCNKELYSNYKKLYILCLDDNVTTIDNMYFMKDFSKERFEKSKKEYVLIEGSMKMLTNINHKLLSSIVNKYFLENYNKLKYNLNENELVLCIPNISKSDVLMYVKLYSGYNKVTDYIKLKILMDYFNCNTKNSIVNTNLKSLVYSLDESNYWTNRYNCKLNTTKSFIDRGFKLSLNSAVLSDEVKKALDKAETAENDNYLQHIYRKQVYVDAASAIKKTGYKIYKIIKEEQLDITHEEVNELINNCSSEKDRHEIYNMRERYNIFNMFLTSKKYCHLVINNPYVLDLMQPFINKFKPLYKYLWGYAWLTFYLEECIKKTRTTINDRYVYKIDTASKLPFFPFCSTDAHMNPYVSLLVSKPVLDFQNNLQGLGMISGYEDYGISDLQTFEKNFNIFSTNNEYISILDGLNWNNVAITGSTMTACIPKKHPLTELFGNQPTEKDKLFRYYQEYYPTSDIDMMCNHTSIFDFIDKVYEVYECVKHNVDNLNGEGTGQHVKLVPYKTLTIVVSTKYVKENLPEYDIDEVIKNRHDNKIKEIFYCKYISKKTEQNKIERKIKSGSVYKSHYDIVPIDDMNLIFTENIITSTNDNIDKCNQIEKNKYYVTNKDLHKKIDLIDEEIDEETDIKENDEEIYFKISENLKYKIESQFLLHKIEIFKIQFPDFFSCVSRFHLPCVRSFYDGNDVYLLPSAITAYMTGINMDYKYFAGSKDPIEIINKNRMRGYTTCINDQEKIHTLEYSRNVEKWQNMMNINIKNKDSINAVFTSLRLKNILFRPRKYNEKLYHECFPVDYEYKNDNKTYVNDFKDLENEYLIRYNYDVKNSDINFLKFKTINEFGYVNPIKKWVIDAAFDELHQF